MNFIPFNMYHNLKILKTEKSKIQDVDFDNFSFKFAELKVRKFNLSSRFAVDFGQQL